MSVERITPRMRAALTDNKPLVYFADIWTSVLNKTCDSQAEWQAASSDLNMDYTTVPGMARLDTAAGVYTLEQTSQDTNFDLDDATDTFTQAMQSFVLTDGREIDQVTVRVDNSGGGAATLYAKIITNPVLETIGYYTTLNYTTHCSGAVAVTATYTGTKDIAFTPTKLNAGTTYYILVYQSGSSALNIQYDNTDVYAGGGFWTVTRSTRSYPFRPTRWLDTIASVTGDMYFSLSLSGYVSVGYVTTPTLDLGEAPAAEGVFQASYNYPAGTNLTFTAYGSTTGAFGGEETTYTDIADGEEIGAFRFWRVKCTLASNISRNESPSVDMVEVIFPKRRVRMRENIALRNVSDELVSSYEPLMANVSINHSEIKVLERLASGGSSTIEVRASTIEPLLRMVSDSPLKNFRGILYAGADVPGLVETDLLRYFIGVIDAATLKPRYRTGTYGLTLTCKNPILELTRKVPQVSSGGSYDVATNAISYDGEHALDAALDLMRGEAGIPARYINLDALATAKATLGNAWLVRRSNAAGLTDTRLKSPEEVKKHLASLAQIIDGYWIVDESSRITIVLHDTTAASEADWADETLVKDGLDAIPIESVSEIRLGYDDWLYNACICGAGWDGSGGDWKAFDVVYAGADSDSADDFAPGVATYWSLMEKNLLEASKWLEDSSGYNGGWIAQTLASRYATRFAYPPLRLVGVVVPMSQFMRTLGSIVTVTSEEVAKFGRRRIDDSETVKFMVTKKTYDRGKNRMVFDLMELK